MTCKHDVLTLFEEFERQTRDAITRLNAGETKEDERPLFKDAIRQFVVLLAEHIDNLESDVSYLKGADYARTLR